MAEPTTRSGLATRIVALKVELAELHAGALKLDGGLDAGSAINKDAAHGIAKRVALESKGWQAAGASALIGKLTE
jgi:hypothetical protein